MTIRVLLLRLVRIVSVLALASACGHVADDGSSTSWAACSLNSECTLAGKSCCEPCGMPTLAEVDAVNSSRLAEHRSALCPGPVVCAPCQVPSTKNPNLLATCSNAVCHAEDVRTEPASACATDDDCRLRTASCCECGGSTASDSLIAVNRSNESLYAALVCDRLQACPQCAPIYPTDVTAHCATDGHCAIRAATAP
ncbi:MAG TPA: hypothetical protein VF395_22015 [Polyangiaceae bacterium]